MKRDLIKVCNDQNVALKDFQAAFCIRCLNRECSRSSMSSDQFSNRTSTWVERLFTNIPRMDSQDPRFKNLSAQNFIEVPGKESRPLELTSEWVDPLNPVPQEPPPEVSAPVPATNPEPIPEPEVSESIEEPEPKAKPAGHNLSMNTPNRNGVMIGSAQKPAEAAPVDPWAEPTKPEPPTGNVVRPGARIRFSNNKR